MTSTLSMLAVQARSIVVELFGVADIRVGAVGGCVSKVFTVTVVVAVVEPPLLVAVSL